MTEETKAKWQQMQDHPMAIVGGTIVVTLSIASVLFGWYHAVRESQAESERTRILVLEQRLVTFDSRASELQIEKQKRSAAEIAQQQLDARLETVGRTERELRQAIHAADDRLKGFLDLEYRLINAGAEIDRLETEVGFLRGKVAYHEALTPEAKGEAFDRLLAEKGKLVNTIEALNASIDSAHAAREKDIAIVADLREQIAALEDGERRSIGTLLPDDERKKRIDSIIAMIKGMSESLIPSVCIDQMGLVPGGITGGDLARILNEGEVVLSTTRAAIIKGASPVLHRPLSAEAVGAIVSGMISSSRHEALMALK